MLSPVVYQRDMATQMSPMGSTHSSPEGSSSFSTSLPSVPAVMEPCSSTGSIKVEIRDVEIDKGDNLTRHSKRHGLRSTNKASPPWGIAEAAKNMTKYVLYFSTLSFFRGSLMLATPLIVKITYTSCFKIYTHLPSYCFTFPYLSNKSSLRSPFKKSYKSKKGISSRFIKKNYLLQAPKRGIQDQCMGELAKGKS